MADRLELLLEAERRGLLNDRQTELLGEARRRGLVPEQSFAQTPPVPIETVEGEIEPAAQPSLTTEEMFDLDPTVEERGMVFPIGRTESGEIVATPSDMMMEGLDAISAFARAMRGQQPTPEEALMIAGLITPGVPTGIPRTVPTGRRLLGREAAEQAAREAGEQAAEAAAEEAGQGFIARRLRSTAVPLRETAEDAATQARRARFEELDIPATLGQVSQDFAQQADESRLASMAGDPNAEPLRQLLLRQSNAFQERTNQLVDSLGVPEEAGARIKAALTGRRKFLRDEKNRLYKQAAESAPEVLNTPLFTDEIVEAIPDRKTLRRIKRLVPTESDAVDDLLVEFGIDTDPAAVKAFVDGGDEITPLTLGNFEDFRAALNNISRKDQSGTIDNVIGPIRDALDDEALFIDQAVKEAGVTDEGVLGTLQEARRRVGELKTEFSPQSITGRLIDKRRDGVTPVIEASQATQQLLRRNAPIENLDRTLKSLRAGGKEGTKAIGDLQATVIADALEASLKAPSRKTSGVETIGGNQFAKALDNFGDDKLDLLFANNREALNRLRDLKQTAQDIMPAAAATPKGSAPVLLDSVLQMFFTIPGVPLARSFIRAASASDERGMQRAMQAGGPTFKRSVANLVNRYPGIAARLGFTAAGTQLEEAPEPALNLEDLADTA